MGEAHRNSSERIYERPSTLRIPREDMFDLCGKGKEKYVTKEKTEGTTPQEGEDTDWFLIKVAGGWRIMKERKACSQFGELATSIVQTLFDTPAQKDDMERIIKAVNTYDAGQAEIERLKEEKRAIQIMFDRYRELQRTVNVKRIWRDENERLRGALEQIVEKGASCSAVSMPIHFMAMRNIAKEALEPRKS